MNRAAGSRTFGRSVRQFEGLFHLEVRQTFDLENPARKDIFLALLLYRQQALFDRIVRNRIDQIAQGHTRLHLTLETHQHRFRHIERHHTRRRGKGHQSGTGGKRNADRESGMTVATGADSVRQKQAVEPGMDHAVARLERDSTTIGDKARQLAVHFHVNQLRVGGGVTERLHHQIRRKTETGQILEFIARHRARGVLRSHRGHARFAIGARTDALPFGQTAGAADHFLRQRKTFVLIGFVGRLRQSE